MTDSLKALVPRLFRLPRWMTERHVLGVVGALFCAAILAVTAVLLERDKHVTLQAETEKGRLLTSTLEGSLSRTLNAIDGTLDNVVHLIEDTQAANGVRGASETTLIERRIHTVVHGSSYLRSILVIDSQQRIQYSSEPGHQGILVDLEALGLPPELDHALAPGCPQFGRDIAGLVSHGETDVRCQMDKGQNYVLPLARSAVISGQPVTLVALANPPSLFPDFRSSLGDNNYAALFDYRGRVLATSGAAPLAVNGTYYEGPMFASLDAEKEFGQYRATKEADHFFIVNFRAARKYPFVATVGVSETTAVAQWRKTSRTLLWLGLLTALFSAIYTVTLWRVMRKREQIARQLETAKASAENAYAARGTFLSTVSHEIRTPMNAVIGMASLLRETPLDAEQESFAKTIEDSATALLNIINDVLDFSKIDAGKMDIEIIDFDLLNVVEGSVDVLAQKARANNLSMMSFVDPALTRMVTGDPGRLRQVLINLIGNAIKFTPSGSVFVHAFRVKKSHGKQRVRFEIVDTGIGMTAATVDNLFTPFTQADGSVTRKYGGTGLGLSICKRLVDLMGGTIGVLSKPGSGSTFWFELPLEVPFVVNTSFDDSVVHDCKRVAVIGLESKEVEIICSYLKSWRIEPLITPTARQAIESPWSTISVDVVLIDGNQHEYSATDIVKELRKRHPSLRYVMTTDNESMRDHALSNGFDAVLLKPFKQSALFDAIVSVNNQQLRRAIAEDGRPTAIPHVDTEEALKDNRLILLVEDNVMNQKVAVRQLHLLGYAAHIANNGQEALDAIERFPYALILMDCQMPIMDGFEATRRIRRAQRRIGRRMHIIALTANAMQGDRERCIEAGMDDYLAKPILRDQLAAMLERYLPAPSASTRVASIQTASLPEPVLQTLNVTRFTDMFGDDPEVRHEMLELFVSTTRPILDQFVIAAARQDYAEITAIAHRVAGSGANIGADELADLARQAQRAADTLDKDYCLALHHSMMTALERLYQLVKQEKFST